MAVAGRRRPRPLKHLQEARLTPPYPKCAANIPSPAIRMPAAALWSTGRPPQPCRIAHPRTLRCSPRDATRTRRWARERPSASIASCKRRREWSWQSLDPPA